MNASRVEPRVHCYARPLAGGYVPAAATTPARLAAVFAAERERLAQLAKPKRRRRAVEVPGLAVPGLAHAQPEESAQLRLVG